MMYNADGTLYFDYDLHIKCGGYSIGCLTKHLIYKEWTGEHDYIQHRTYYDYGAAINNISAPFLINDLIWYTLIINRSIIKFSEFMLRYPSS